MPELTERRFLPTDEMELRVDETNGVRTLSGYPIVYNSLSVMMYGFREQVAPGAFNDSIRDDDVLALINHDRNHILGRTRSGTVNLVSTKKGVRMDVELPDRQDARDLVVSVERGDITGGSFAFSVLPDGDQWNEDAEGMVTRTIKRGKLYDVGPVASPAYPGTEGTMTARSVEAALESLDRWRADREMSDKAWMYSSAVRERLLRMAES